MIAVIKMCMNCQGLKSEGASSDCPHPSVWCSAGHWEGIMSREEENSLWEATDCIDWVLISEK
jgi:hypothetical protein